MAVYNVFRKSKLKQLIGKYIVGYFVEAGSTPVETATGVPLGLPPSGTDTAFRVRRSRKVGSVSDVSDGGRSTPPTMFD